MQGRGTEDVSKVANEPREEEEAAATASEKAPPSSERERVHRRKKVRDREREFVLVRREAALYNL